MTTELPSAWRYTIPLQVSSQRERELLHELIDAAINFGMSFRVTSIRPAGAEVLFISSVASTEQDALRDLGLQSGS